MNHGVRHIYGKNTQAVRGEDIIAVLDCDQVCTRHFFTRTVPVLQVSEEIALVGFAGVNPRVLNSRVLNLETQHWYMPNLNPI